MMQFSWLDRALALWAEILVLLFSNSPDWNSEIMHSKTEPYDRVCHESHEQILQFSGHRALTPDVQFSGHKPYTFLNLNHVVL